MKQTLFSLATIVTTTFLSAEQPADHLVFEGDASKPGQNKHVVLLAGDDEYRSEEAMPMLAQILAEQGFKCTVLFSMDKKNTYVLARNQVHLSHPGALDSADAILMNLRFRNWPEASFDKFTAAFERGIPIGALRTSTHAFRVPKEAKYHKYSFDSKIANWEGGFGRQVLGESWLTHWGKHAAQGTNTYAVETNKSHPILNNVGQIFARTDLYEAAPLQPSTILLEGQITTTLEKSSKELLTGKGAKRQACAWVREFKHENGNTSNIFTTTLGSSDDLTDENLRRLVVNSVYWGLGLDVPEKAKVDYLNTYLPTFYGIKSFNKKGDLRRGPVPNMKPADFISFDTPHK